MSVPPPPVYLFGIVRTAPAAGPVPDGLALRTGCFRQPRLLPCGDVAAIVAELVLRQGESLEDLLQDNEQAKDLVLDHHRILESMADEHAVLPLRFGAVFQHEQAIEDVLELDRDHVREALDRIDDAQEWGLRIYCARDRLEQRIRNEAPAIVRLRDEIGTTGDGKAFFLRRRLDSLTGQEVEQAIERCLADTVGRLESAVRGVTSGKVHGVEVHGRESDMVFNGACLVKRGDKAGFFGLIEELRESYRAPGFDYDVTGPWPPYSFADCRLGSHDQAA